jgi:hypothetical protein
MSINSPGVQFTRSHAALIPRRDSLSKFDTLQLLVVPSDTQMADRSRREMKDKLDKLAEYKRVREGGRRTWIVRDGPADWVSRRKQTLTCMTKSRRINIRLLSREGSRRMILWLMMP